MKPVELHDPAVISLAELLDTVRAKALEARAALTAIPEVVAHYEAQIASALEGESRVLAAIRAISPDAADALTDVPVKPAPAGRNLLRMKVEDSYVVRRITRGDTFWGSPHAPPVAQVMAPSSVQDLKELVRK